MNSQLPYLLATILQPKTPSGEQSKDLQPKTPSSVSVFAWPPTPSLPISPLKCRALLLFHSPASAVWMCISHWTDKAGLGCCSTTPCTTYKTRAFSVWRIQIDVKSSPGKNCNTSTEIAGSFLDFTWGGIHVDTHFHNRLRWRGHARTRTWVAIPPSRIREPWRVNTRGWSAKMHANRGCAFFSPLSPRLAVQFCFRRGCIAVAYPSSLGNRTRG